MTFEHGHQQGHGPADTASATAWLFVSSEHLPESWQHRAVPASLVPLLPEEAEGVLRDGATPSTLDADDLQLARLIAGGVPVAKIATRLHLAPRSVYRRLAELRKRMGVGNITELVAELARRGF